MVTELGQFSQPTGMASNGDGFLYLFNNFPHVLLKINPATGVVSPIKYYEQQAHSLAFTNDGSLVTKFSGDKNLYSLDVETGEPSVLCPMIFPSSDVGGLSTDPYNGLLYGLQAFTNGDSRMYTIDTTTCTFTRICTVQTSPGVGGRGLDSLEWNPNTDMFLASLHPNALFDLDIDCTVSNVRETDGYR